MTNLAFEQAPAEGAAAAPETQGGDVAGIGADVRPVPRISIQAFCESPEVGSAIEAASADRRMARAHVKVHTGGIAAAAEFYQAAATPNTVFSGTAIPAAISDSFTAAQLSGSTIARQKAFTPPAKASSNTSASGSSSRMAMKARATAPSSAFSQAGSSVGFAERRREPERPFKKIALIVFSPPSFAIRSAPAA